jgi:hypothetical protein
MVHRKQAGPLGQDLRKAADRRAFDGEPPQGWRERRRTVERRMPTVKEDEISQNEWFKRMAAFLIQRSKKKEEIRRAFESLEGADNSS